MSWRLAQSIDTLRKEVNARWPGRSKASDGTIGDAAHASRTSDHNPWVKVDGIGVVRAIDITANGIDANAYAEHLRSLGKAGDTRLNPDGYVIWNRRIASQKQGWAWRPYKGSNPHNHHVHLSVSSARFGFDSTAPWGLTGAITPPPPPPPPPGGPLMVTPDDEAKIRAIVSDELKPLEVLVTNLVTDLIPADSKTKGPLLPRVRDSLARIEAKLGIKP